MIMARVVRPVMLEVVMIMARVVRAKRVAADMNQVTVAMHTPGVMVMYQRTVAKD